MRSVVGAGRVQEEEVGGASDGCCDDECERRGWDGPCARDAQPKYAAMSQCNDKIGCADGAEELRRCRREQRTPATNARSTIAGGWCGGVWWGACSSAQCEASALHNYTLAPCMLATYARLPAAQVLLAQRGECAGLGARAQCTMHGAGHQLVVPCTRLHFPSS